MKYTYALFNLKINRHMWRVSSQIRLRMKNAYTVLWVFYSMLVTVHPVGNLQSGRICKEVKIGNPGECFCHWAFITHQKQHGGKRDHHRVHTEWQRPLSGVRFIMMEKLAQSGDIWGCMARPNPFHYIYHHVRSCGARSSWEGRYTPPFSNLPLYVLCGYHILYFVFVRRIRYVCNYNT
jgi:hypothetical protein